MIKDGIYNDCHYFLSIHEKKDLKFKLQCYKLFDNKIWIENKMRRNYEYDKILIKFICREKGINDLYNLISSYYTRPFLMTMYGIKHISWHDESSNFNIIRFQRKSHKHKYKLLDIKECKNPGSVSRNLTSRIGFGFGFNYI
jgi:hypothetical protein